MAEPCPNPAAQHPVYWCPRQPVLLCPASLLSLLTLWITDYGSRRGCLTAWSPVKMLLILERSREEGHRRRSTTAAPLHQLVDRRIATRSFGPSCIFCSVSHPLADSVPGQPLAVCTRSSDDYFSSESLPHTGAPSPSYHGPKTDVLARYTSYLVHHFSSCHVRPRRNELYLPPR